MELKEREFSPLKNSKMISIELQEDGNYKGWMQKNGILIEAREIGPETVLQRLLTKE